MCIRGEIIFIYKILWNVFKAESDKFWSIHRRGQVKNADAKSYKLRMAAGDDAVDDKFYKFERACRFADVPGVTDAVSSNGDTRSVMIFFVGPVLTHNLGVRDLVTTAEGDIFVSDDPESVSYLNTFFVWGL